MLVRNASSTQDERTKILKAIGKLADVAISDDSREISMKELTESLKGQPMSKETFDKYGIETQLIKEQNKPEILIVTVPPEYLPNSLVENGPAQVSFTVTKVLDMDFRRR